MRDIDVRKAVRICLRDMHAGEPDTVFLEEMDLWSGSARIDMAVVNGVMAGFEIKSDRDTLERLPRQILVYNRIFDEVSLVVGKRHAEKALLHVPEWWGIYIAVSVGDSVMLEHRRPTVANPELDPMVIADLLDKAEIIQLLEKRNLAYGWRNKPVRLVQERLATNLSIDELREEVRTVFKQRAASSRELTAHQLDMPVD